MKTGRVSTFGVGGRYWMSSRIGVAQHHRAWRIGEIHADLERRLVDLRRHAAVVHEIVDEIAHALHRGLTARFARLFQRRRVAQQEIRRCESVADETEQEVCALPVDRIEADCVDPFVNAAFERKPVLRDAPVDAAFTESGVFEPCVFRIGRRVGCAEGNTNRFLPQTRCVFDADRGLQQPLAENLGASFDDIVDPETDDWVQCKRTVHRRFLGMRGGVF